MTKIDFNALMDYLKEKHPYSMYRWVNDTYWITDEVSDSSTSTVKKEED